MCSAQIIDGVRTTKKHGMAVHNIHLLMNCPKVHVVGFISLSWMSVLTNNLSQQSEAFVHAERLESSVETAVSCGVECEVVTPVTIEHFFHVAPCSNGYSKSRSELHTLLLSWSQVDVNMVYTVIQPARQTVCRVCWHPARTQRDVSQLRCETSRSTCDTNTCIDQLQLY